MNGVLTARIPGGAVKMRESESEKPIPWRMIVMKNPMAYAGTVEAKNMNAIIRHVQLVSVHTKRNKAVPKSQRTGSAKCFHSFCQVILSGIESPLSASTRSRIICKSKHVRGPLRLSSDDSPCVVLR
jgi:hypothetical protein